MRRKIEENTELILDMINETAKYLMGCTSFLTFYDRIEDMCEDLDVDIYYELMKTLYDALGGGV